MTPEQLQQQIQEATELIASWPEWKRNVLRDSGKSMCDVPRKPIIQQEESMDCATQSSDELEKLREENTQLKSQNRDMILCIKGLLEVSKAHIKANDLKYKVLSPALRMVANAVNEIIKADISTKKLTDEMERDVQALSNASFPDSWHFPE